MDSSEPHPSVSYQFLLEKFELTKKELGEAEETIKRITGRDPDLLVNGPGAGNKWKNQPGVAPGNRQFQGRKRPLFPIGDEVKAEEDNPPEDSPDEEEGSTTKKPALQSTVVATPKDIKSRKDTIQGQNVNSKVKARNRRMFGMILGTLQKFQHEETKRKEQDLKRAEIEQKVEAAAAEEKERIKKEKEDLFLTRREKQIQLRCLEKKIEIVQLHETWANNEKHMLNFIKTTAEPQIFYLPAVPSSKSEKRLAESKVKISEGLQQKKEKMEKDLSEVEELYKKDCNFPSDKENIGPLDSSESQNVPEVNEEEMPVEESENVIAENEERTNETNTENLPDQEFEPIYD